MKEQELDDRLGAAPRKAQVPSDPWPGIESVIRWRRRRPVVLVSVSMAAGVALAIGSIGGFLLGQRSVVLARGDSGTTTPFLAAARVQEAGSQYLAAVAALQGLGSDPSREQTMAVTQGYESALAVVEAVARVVEGPPSSGGRGSGLSAEAARMRASLDARVSSMLNRGGAQ